MNEPEETSNWRNAPKTKIPKSSHSKPSHDADADADANVDAVEDSNAHAHANTEHAAPRIFLAPSDLLGSQSHGVELAKANSHQVPTVNNKPQSILSYLPKLWAMCRPSNFMGVVLFHILGTFLVIQKSTYKLPPVLLHPQQLVVLITLLLTSATSMMVNDYYDSKIGLDSTKTNKPSAPSSIVKKTLGILYAQLLLCITLVPGIPARVSCVVGVMLTFQYTRHLKPITWVKTGTCALLIALSPLTSGAAAQAILNNKYLSATTNASTLSQLGFVIPSSMWRLTAMLFFGFFAREVHMDIVDVVDDRLHRIRTIPVRYGRQFASQVAFISTLVMSLICSLGTIYRVATFPTKLSAWRQQLQVALALLGSVAQIRRAYQVVQSNGTSLELLDKAVEEGKFSVLFLLASYL